MKLLYRLEKLEKRFRDEEIKGSASVGMEHFWDNINSPEVQASFSSFYDASAVRTDSKK